MTVDNALDLSTRTDSSQISVAARFPTELLQHIFLLSMYPRAVWAVSVRSPPFVLSHVCSRWRAVTLGFPQLWSWVLIDFSGALAEETDYHDGEVQGGRPSEELLTCWLECSKKLPLRCCHHRQSLRAGLG